MTSSFADTPAPPAMGTVETLVVDSDVLRGNPLGDPCTRRIPVWLPPSYHSTDHATADDARAMRYPVVYLLAGYGSTGSSLFQGGPWAPTLAERLGRLVQSGAMGELIVVAPDGLNRYGGSQYLDSSATGLYESHICAELIPAVERQFRAVRHRDGRAIAGRSSGGFGALVLAMRHPDLFSAVASHAGDGYFELSIAQDLPKAFRSLRRHGGIDGFLRHFDAAPAKRPEDVATMMVLAISAAYAPDRGQPHGFALPFDPHTGEIVPAVWQRFKAWDPVTMVATHAEALRRMKLVFLDAGDRDEWALDIAARVLADRMRAAGVNVEHEEFEGGHMGTSHRYEVSLPRLAAALGARPAPHQPDQPPT
jgi:S-formylglutathione hydrolase FrmB